MIDGWDHIKIYQPLYLIPKLVVDLQVVGFLPAVQQWNSGQLSGVAQNMKYNILARLFLKLNVLI